MATQNGGNMFAEDFMRFLPSKNADAIVTGYCAGALADGRLEKSEIDGLRTLIAHSGVTKEVEGLLSDMLSEWEAGDLTSQALAERLGGIAGGDLAAGETPRSSTAFCNQRTPRIDFACTFVFTGEFMGRTRSQCVEVAERLGGTVKTGVSAKVDYLIVGTSAPPAYLNGTRGGKIAKALAIQKTPKGQGRCPIVSEDDWLAQQGENP